MDASKTSKKAVAKRTGRPRKTIDYGEVEKFASEGLTDAQLAVMLDISPKTLYSRKQDDEAFLAAYEKGEAKAIAAIESTMFKLALDGDSAACRFILSTRRRGTYTTRQEVANADGEPFRLTAVPLTPEQRREAIIEITEALEDGT